MRLRPGAFSWYQGAASVESATALQDQRERWQCAKAYQPKPRRGPVIKLFTKSLSSRVVAFLAPMRHTSSVVCWGVKASMTS